MAGARRLQCLPVLGRLAAHPSRRRWRHRAPRPRFLRPPGRRAHHPRRHAVALPLPLGFAAGAAGPGRLAQARYRRQIRRLCAHRGAAPGRPRQALGDVQRAQHPRAVRLRHGRPCARAQGLAEFSGRQSPPEFGAGAGAPSAARRARRSASRHRDQHIAGAAVVGSQGRSSRRRTVRRVLERRFSRPAVQRLLSGGDCGRHGAIGRRR